MLHLDPSYAMMPATAYPFLALCSRCSALVPPDWNTQQKHTDHHREQDGVEQQVLMVAVKRADELP